MNIAIILSLVAATIMAIIAVFHAGKKQEHNTLIVKADKLKNQKQEEYNKEVDKLKAKYEKVHQKLDSVGVSINELPVTSPSGNKVRKAKTTRDRRYSFKQSGLR